MLYLNFLSAFRGKYVANLTLTNVVFELLIVGEKKLQFINLTLTNVVFELHRESKSKFSIEFNFNKCCI